MSDYKTIRVSLPTTMLEAIEELSKVTSLDRSIIIEGLLPKDIPNTTESVIRDLANLQAKKSIKAYQDKLAENAKANSGKKSDSPKTDTTK